MGKREKEKRIQTEKITLNNFKGQESEANQLIRWLICDKQGCMKFHIPLICETLKGNWPRVRDARPGENDFKTNWEAFQKGRKEGKKKRGKGQKIAVWWTKKRK